MAERLVYYALFGVATLALSGVFRAWRAMTSPGPLPALEITLGLISVVGLLGSVFFLGFFVYRDEKKKGRLQREMRIYEKMLNWRRDH